VTAEPLDKVTLDEDQLVLLDVLLNYTTLTRSIEAYEIDDKLLLAIEPLFDALKIRYIISDTNLSIWQNDVEQTFELNQLPQRSNSNNYQWASDDFYLFIELALFEHLFPTKMDFLYETLQLKITTGPNVVLFPIQKLAEQSDFRARSRISGNQTNNERVQLPITIADQYRLLTVPHGRVNIAASSNQTDSGFNGSAQLTGDLLYHSASLTLSDSNVNNLAARLTLGRFKTTPDDYILGLYDQYQFGDVSSISNGINTATRNGLGFIINRYEDNFRQSNQAITLQEVAPPGWEAELFRNNIFLATAIVPANGLLTFNDVEVEYGPNNYQIKLYGPFGETETRKKNVQLDQNVLSKGQFSHALYGLDSNHQIINDQSDSGYGLTDYGGTFDYGITDNWQLGFGYAALEGNQQFYNIKNAFSLPSMLLENDISLDQDGNYAQVTSLKGGAFEIDRYTLILESSDNFSSNRVQALGKSLNFQGSYTRPTEWVNLNFNLGYRKDDLSKTISVSNRLSGNIGNIRLRHSLSYAEQTSLQLDQGISSSTILGSLGISGNLPFSTRISANIQYDPEADDPFLNSSSIVIQKTYTDPWAGHHSLSANYQPLATGSASDWRISHRASWQTESFQLNLSTNYDKVVKWSFQLGLQFFLGYDYRNNRLLLNQKLQSNSATLDVHTYLDRQLNGIPDPLDYDLTDVEFSGNPAWENIESGSNGHTVLPGVYAATPFTFGAKWKNGSNTINNDYVVYTHPGAYVDVNMPFVLSTELVGFVLRIQNEQEIGMQNVSMELTDENGELIQVRDTDIDGYYEFNGLPPGQYGLRVSGSNLVDKGLTTEIAGYSILTGGQGGYSELPAFRLRRLNNEESSRAQDTVVFSLNAENTEPVVWDEDANKRQNYFTLPTKNKVIAKHSLTQNGVASPLLNQSAEVNNIIDTSLQQEPQPQVANGPMTRSLPILSKLSLSGELPRVSIAAPLAIQKNNVPPQQVISTVAKETTSAPQLQVGSVSTFPTFQENNVTPQRVIAAVAEETTSVPIKVNEVFVIQLGAYANKQYAQDLINNMEGATFLEDSFTIVESLNGENNHLTYGAFPSLESGIEFAESYMPQGQPYFVRIKKVTESTLKQNNVQQQQPNQGWVIQFYASKEPLSQTPSIKEYAAIGSLYTAIKESTNNSELYYLISESYPNKETAKIELARSGLSGWINSRDKYKNVNQL
jgi:cell division septation protein DedD